MKTTKHVGEMSLGELRVAWEHHKNGNVRRSARNEYQQRRATTRKIAIAKMMDTVGLSESLAIMAGICEDRSKTTNEGDAFLWTVRMDVLRNAAEETS